MASSERNTTAVFGAGVGAPEPDSGAKGGARARKLREINLILAESARENLALKAQARPTNVQPAVAQPAAASAHATTDRQAGHGRPGGGPEFRFLQLSDFKRLDPAAAGTRRAADASEPRPAPRRAVGFVSKSVALNRLHTSRLRARRPYERAAIEARAASMNTGARQRPILVRPHPVIAEDYEIVVGELPYLAARSAGLDRLPVVVCRLSDHRALECVLLEDARRPDLEPLELAVGYGELIRRFGHRLGDLARLTGRSERKVAKILLLLDSKAAARPAAQGAGAAAADGAPESGPKPTLNAEVAALERKLSGALGMKVEMSAHGRRGDVRISFADLDQLEWIARHLSARRSRPRPASKDRGLAA